MRGLGTTAIRDPYEGSALGAGASRPGSEPYPTLARLSLLFGLSAGFSLGFLLMLPVAFGVPLQLPWLVLVQVHGHVQLLGFTALFVLAVGSIILPHFLGAPLRRPGQITLGGVLLALAVSLRSLAQPFEPSIARSIVLALSAVLAPSGVLLFAWTIHTSCRHRVQPAVSWQRALMASMGSLLVSLVLNAVAVYLLIADGRQLIPPALDEAILHLQIWGFAVSMILAVSMRVFPRFLLLRPERAAALDWLVPGYAGGVLLTALGWLVLQGWPVERALAASVRAAGASLSLLALTGFVLALRLYEKAARASGTPHVTNPTRLWFRLAYAWLLCASLLNAGLYAREALGGVPPASTELSAARHALTMGFLIVLLVGMAARILPGYSSWALRRPRFLGLVIGLLLAGALLRVGGELTGGYGGIAGTVVGLGGALSTLGFLLFATSLWPTLGRPVFVSIDR